MAILMVVAALIPGRLVASPYISLQNGDQVQVIEIIDINAIRVRTNRGDALVRLIGIHHGGTPEGINFLTREIMGSYVHVVRDAAFPNVGRWNYMYVMQVERFINGELILTGYGRLNEAHSRATQFENIQAGQAIARDAGLGMWAQEHRTPIITQYGERININTATAAQIVAQLGATQAVADSIVNFRTFTVFQTVNDVKFVPGVTWEFFATNRHRMTISTNINTANIAELESLTNVSDVLARNIVDSRSGGRSFTELNQLVTRNILTTWHFNTILPFISLQPQTEIQFARPNNRANINLASTHQLTMAGASFMQASNITTQRNHLPLRNLQDLNNLAGFETMAQINALADNLRAYTNINTAPRSEIESLFGGGVSSVVVDNIINNRPHTSPSDIEEYMTAEAFDRISPFIYVGSRPVDILVNINTATHRQLVDANFTDEEASRLIAVRPILRPSFLDTWQVQVWVRQELRQDISLFTNINTASSQELLTLDGAMTQDVVSRIVTHRNDQPFGSLAEVEEFFSADQAMRDLFVRIRGFVILR